MRVQEPLWHLNFIANRLCAAVQTASKIWDNKLSAAVFDSLLDQRPCDTALRSVSWHGLSTCALLTLAMYRLQAAVEKVQAQQQRRAIPGQGKSSDSARLFKV